MTESPKPPAELRRLQRAFGASIAVPLEFLDDDGNYTIQFDQYVADAVGAVKGRGEQSSAERIAVYNQQYWFRLLTIMQDEFPLTEALLGIQAFNRLAMDYLVAEPPDSVRLRDLSNRFEAYVASRELPAYIAEAIALERVFIESFDTAHLPVPDTSNQEVATRLATEPLRFQPHFALLQVEHNVVELRRRLRAGESVGAEDVDVTPTARAYWRGNGIQSVELGSIQAALLGRVVAGESLADACEALVEALEPPDVEFLATHVQRWFGAWASAEWFVAPADL